ncbi:unnamed protein product [Lasius platythorax]|uniref:Uncharacterized protein n=1 Tax=Lasius platythorax TaxID=488582 RepID=A0AAV2NSK4_9HYME
MEIEKGVRGWWGLIAEGGKFPPFVSCPVWSSQCALWLRHVLLAILTRDPYLVQHASGSHHNFHNENIFQKRFDLTHLTGLENVERTSLLSS